MHTHVVRQDAAFALAILPEQPAHAVQLRGSKHTPGVMVFVLLQPRRTSATKLIDRGQHAPYTCKLYPNRSTQQQHHNRWQHKPCSFVGKRGPVACRRVHHHLVGAQAFGNRRRHAQFQTPAQTMACV